MNKLYCLIILFFTCRICDAQNLVPNPSFEIHDTCPDQNSQIARALGWVEIHYSPDYLNICSSNIYASIPNNIFGNQLPVSINDSAYAGLITIIANSTHEIMGINLIDTLSIGQKYYVSFLVSAGYAQNSAVHISCFNNKMGMKFCTHPYTSNWNPQLIDNIAQVYTSSIVSDTLNWIQIKGSFIADSSYTFVMIGNFFLNDLSYSCTDTVPNIGSYTFIDDVCVSTDSLTCNLAVGLNETKNTDDFVLFPNPFADKLNITVKGNETVEINLYDITARKIFSQSFINSTSINTEQLAKGIYLYEVRNKNGVVKNGKVVKNSP